MYETSIDRITYNKPLFYSIVLGVFFWVAAVCGTLLSGSEEKPIGILWFYAAFSLLVLVGVITVTCTGLLIKYRVTVLSFTSIGFTFSVLAIQNLTFKLDTPTIIATIGYFLFTFVLFFWMLTIGHLGDFKESETVLSSFPARYLNTEPNHRSIGELESFSGLQNHTGGLETNLEELQYNIRAQALYTYNVNPNDSSELSFEKGEILFIGETQGKWWPARNAQGQTGVVPSNYIQLL